MSVDVFTYMTNMYAERTKAKYGHLDDRTRFALEVYIPTFSVCALLGVTAWITSDAVAVIQSGGDGDDVNVIFLFAFASGNFIVDLGSSFMFYLKRDNVLVNDHLHTFSLDRRSFDWQMRPLIPNLNMISALTHVGSDTLRTASVFIAAVVATAGKQPGSLCDAWAAIVVTITIVAAVIPLCLEIYKAATSTTHSEMEQPGERV